MSRRNMPKKINVLCALFAGVLVIATALGVTAAYYKAETEKVENQFSVGNVTTELVEEFEQLDDLGTEFKKTPMVTNTGANACIIRMRMNVTPESLLTRLVKDEHGNNTAQKYLEISGLPGADWTYNAEDGFYYYNKVVKPGESTSALFDKVIVNFDEYNPWMDFDIVMYQEAVQAVAKSNQDTITATDLETMYQIWKLYDSTQ